MFDELMQLFEDYAEMELSADDKVMDLELDSLIMIDLLNNIERKYGVRLKISKLINMTVGDVIEYVSAEIGSKDQDNEIIMTSPTDEFELNDLQKAYWVGRSGEYELGNVSTHVYIEFEKKDLDFEKFKEAVKKLVERHEMLRATITSDGKQRILPFEADKINIPFKDLSIMSADAKESLLINERKRMSHEVFEINASHFFAVQVFKLDETAYRIFVSIDMLIADACSLSIFFRDLNYFYHEKQNLLKPIDFNFRDYIANDVAIEETDKYVESDAYWTEKCKSIAPAPSLQLERHPSEIKRPKFAHAQRTICAESYDRLKKQAKDHNLTIPAILLSVYCDILSVWSSEKRFSVNVTNLDRRKYSDSVDDLIGQFASFTIMSAEGCRDRDFYNYAKDIQKELWDDLDHRYIGGTKILQKLRAESGRMEGALMPVVFTCILQDMAQTDWLGDIVYSISQTSQIWLDNQTLEKNGELVLSWDYLEDLFPTGMIEEMLDAYEGYIYALADGSKAQILGQKHLEMRNKCNETEDADKLVHISDLLERSFDENKDRICIVNEGRTFTYGEVDDLADKIVDFLREQRLNDERHVVAIIMEKSYKQVISALGVVKAGYSYVPIDPSLPKDRLEYIIEDCGASVVISYSSATALDRQDGVTYVEFDEIMARECSKFGYQAAQDDDCMYMIYTSGSTGKPSGVIVNRGGVGNAIAFSIEKFNVTSSDVAIAMTPFHHDMSIFDIFGILSAGAKLVIPSDEVRKNPAELSLLMIAEQVSIWNSVPSLLDIFCEYIVDKPSRLPVYLRLAILGGDWISPDMCRTLFDMIAGLRIVSVGGPTETTLWNIYHEFTSVEDDVKRIPYGVPISNTKYYILDDDLKDCPNWVVGNICSTGVGVAAGYCNDEKKQKEKFVEHPVTHERMCISGDIGCYRNDGKIEICGRKDNQVKINGIRIELEEIESSIRQCDGIDNCVVMCDERSKKMLVAFVVAKNKDEHSLEEYLREKLPAYMLPKKYIWVEQIPLNANFKPDRKQLARLLKDTKERLDTPKEAEQTSSDNMQIIGDVVKEVLGIDDLTYDDNISLIGGSSIELIKIINRLEKIYNHRMALEDFFENLTVRKLAAYFGKNTTQLVETNDEAGSATEEYGFINNYEVLLDRHQREMFKMSNMGLRRDLNDREIIQLSKPEITEDVKAEFNKRRSYRNYEKEQIGFEDFSNLLFWISNFDDKEYPNFMYASGGGLYSVQVYVYVMKGGVSGLEQGFYYYDRNSHLLRSLALGVDIRSDVHWSSNQAIYEESAFSIYLVSDYDVIGPMYRNQGVHFATIESGLLSEVLEMKAPEYNIGLCQVGYMDFDRIKKYLELKETHIFMHTLIGGYIDYTGDYVSKQKTREYMKTEYYDGTARAVVEKGFIKAVRVQDLKGILEED